MTALTAFIPSAEDLAVARATIRARASTRLQLEEACGVLCQSPEADDRIAAREVRNTLWSDRASELRPEAREMAARLAEAHWQDDLDDGLQLVGAVVVIAGVIVAVCIVAAIAWRVSMGGV